MSTQPSMVDGKLDVERYIEVREHDSGMYVAIDSIEFAYGIMLPDAVLNHPTIARMRRACANVGGLVNDVISYHKEVEVNDYRFNLLNVLMESRALPFEQAVHEAVLIINDFITDFTQHERHLPTWDDPAINADVRLYVQGMRDQIGASLHWQVATNRYRSHNAPFAELRAAVPPINP